MPDLEDLVRQSLGKLSKDRHGVVVAAVAGDTVEIQGTGGHDATTRFEIGSISKVFTALLLARLTLAGVTSLDEPLRDLLPPGAKVPVRGGQEVTLRHLAQHRSGLSRLPTGMLLRALLRPSTPDPYAACTEEFLLDALGRARLGAVPGRRFRYSNFGAGLLGLALSHRAGISYGALVTREFNLEGTGTDGTTTQGHRKLGRPAEPWHLADLAGAGGLRSTATDLVTFVRAHLAGDPAINLALETGHRLNPFATVHLGWFSRRLKGGVQQYFHNGATGGFFSFAGFDRDSGTGVVVLSDTARSVDNAAFALLTEVGSLS
ncbi:serine hydrolase domain-containing protein [Actinoplanes sp. NPDC051861]|uniref:serine hydrolase domain-containing protein n=1 Tax=Actinoplanes sp. NPDC051861 TaxID=3155170 RepID=UPI0034284506